MRKIDFSKYDKGLRYYATLFRINPKIFNTDQFIDISIYNKFLIIKYSKAPNYYIQKLIEDNDFFYNCIVENGAICYKFKLKTKDQLVDFDLMQTNGTQFCDKKFILDMAILWKEHLDDSFYITLDLITQKGRICEDLAFSFFNYQ